jgi:hypothetical protein
MKARDDLALLAQAIRLLDVFLIGPVMVWGAKKAVGMPVEARAFLAYAGIATVYYNGRNFVLKKGGHNGR